MSVDAQGNAWFADMKGNRVGAYAPPTNHTSTFSFPGPMAPTSVIRTGDTIWIGCKEEVGEMDLNSGEFLDHFVYQMDSYLYDIHIDRLRNVWFVENQANKVGTYYYMYDKTIEFDIPTENSAPTCLDIDSKHRLWFVESGPNKLGMFDTERFSFTEYDLPVIDGMKPVISRVATVNDSVWFTDVKNGRAIRFLPDEGEWTAATLGEGTSPVFIEPDGNGTLWIYESGSKKLASLDVTDQFGQATPTPEPTTQPSPTATPQPTKAPGFLSLLTIAALVSTLYIMTVKK
jgi:streptogramin lyase